MDQRSRDAATRVLTALAADDALVSAVVDAARARSPEVARLPAEENRRHIASLIAGAAAHVERGGAHDDGDFSAACALGADRAAQGVPIADVLRGVRAGRGEVVRTCRALARGLGVDDGVVLDVVVDLDDYVGLLQQHIVSGHRAAELELSRTSRELTTQVLRRLLLPGGGPPADAELRQAGLRPGQDYHCAVSAETDPGRARRLEQRLAPFGGVFGFVEGTLSGLLHAVPVLPEDAPLVVVSPAKPLHDLRVHYPVCTQAVRVAAAQGRTGVHALASLGAETALAGYPVLAAALVDDLLGALDPGNDFHRELAATALSFLDRGCGLAVTAKALHVHANTVRYRLDRFRELTDVDVTDTNRRFVPTLQAWWALRTWLDSCR
ncbi:PucR family transcriptional regulator [Actinokineospora bangkokensis]|uniref:Uncharacterized protein n=1 Tax=Actinokineospora bangkokensis TaxID=1193682 RepID=A0A1Q9LQR4_9PSEU|nr:helix-turn-helix domain-containing protein [Actinokineospora bangkokensis]OLR94386.1 hypothetical protein BJP25_11530 [Actinokineospora bangkokensis]